MIEGSTWMREGRGWGHYNSIERKTSQLVLVRDAVAAIIVTYQVYRKYRSLGTPSRLLPSFRARLLHNQEDVNTDRCFL